MKKLLLPLLLASSVSAEQRNYDAITDRNAFSLLDKPPAKVELPKLLEKPPIKLNLTGIITRRGVTNVYMFSKDVPKRFLTLSSKRRTDSGVTLLSVERGLVKVDNNGVTELLSFDTHKLPSIVTLPKLNTKPTIIKKKDDKRELVKIAAPAPTTPKPNVITVPSRRPKVDPRIIQKGLEYIDRIDDKEKREYILQRLERLQSGQEKIDRKIETNERRRQYDERSRDRKK
jgi:hypothetical protein|tara:strand:+ start:323 stop:1012 length:690 start_codon:yes stop_codon:yes gene_type:complete